MSDVVAAMSMSLDRYLAGPDDSVADVFAGLSTCVDAKLVGRPESDSGAVALRYEPIRNQPQSTERR
jgi:hypothetical protein